MRPFLCLIIAALPIPSGMILFFSAKEFQCFCFCIFISCRNCDGSTCILRAICTIRKGEEINDNYGFSYQIRPKEERQETLSQHYFFTCDCPACKQQWPLFHEKIRGRATIFVCSGCRLPLNQPVEKLKKCPKCKKELKLGKVVRTLNK